MRRDEGVGVRVVERLRERYTFPQNVQLVVGGTRGISLIDHFTSEAGVILVDAILAPFVPGTLVRLRGDEITVDPRQPVSLHHAGAATLLALAKALNRWPQVAIVWGIVPASIDMGPELSSPVAEQLDALVEAVAQDIHALTQGC